MHRFKFTILSVGLALLYWVTESIIHRFVYAEEFFEIVPSDVNEFWMRLLIIVLIVGFGLFADNRARKIRASEREKHEVFMAMSDVVIDDSQTPVTAWAWFEVPGTPIAGAAIMKFSDAGMVEERIAYKAKLG